jgi:hypothetical protein
VTCFMPLVCLTLDFSALGSMLEVIGIELFSTLSRLSRVQEYYYACATIIMPRCDVDIP